MLKRIIITISILSLLLLTASGLLAKTLTFDEIPTQTVNGLHYGGINFTFLKQHGSVFSPSDDAHYKFNIGTATFKYLSSYVLEGDAHYTILSLTFDVPTTLLEFGIAETHREVSQNINITLRDSDSGQININSGYLTLTPQTGYTGYAESLFHYTGDIPVKYLELGFVVNSMTTDDPVTFFNRFSIDNLKYNAAVPEPATMLLLGLGMMGLAGVRRKFKK